MTEARNPFEDRHALIFGGAQGIGRAIALEWARRGARVTIADIDHGAAMDTAAEIQRGGRDAIGLASDVCSDPSIREAADAAVRALGEVDILMNNVGSVIEGHPEDIPIAEWHRIMDVCFFSAVRAIQHFLPAFIARGDGHIVNTASIAGLYPYAASRLPYAAAKAAVVSLTENLAIYLEPLGIRLSCLIPGPVMTTISDRMARWTPDCPMRSSGSELALMTPEEVARKLSDEMGRGSIIIPSHEVSLAIARRFAADPDGFIRGKIEDFARGDHGLPQIPEALRQVLEERSGET